MFHKQDSEIIETADPLSVDEKLMFLSVAKEQYRIRRRKLVWMMLVLTAALVLVSTGVYLLVRQADVSSESVQTTVGSDLVKETSGSVAIAVVKSGDYASCTFDNPVLEPGQVRLGDGVSQALADPVNGLSLFYVGIRFVSTDYEDIYRDFIYLDRTIAEWGELSDLALGFYPYEAYNSDHGGAVSEAEWQDRIQAAIDLDAVQICQDARAAFQAHGLPKLFEARNEDIEAEFKRLKALGYRIWIDKRETDTDNLYILSLQGLLTKTQLEAYHVSSQLGTLVEWVQDEQGIVNWPDETAIE